MGLLLFAWDSDAALNILYVVCWGQISLRCSEAIIVVNCRSWRGWFEFLVILWHFSKFEKMVISAVRFTVYVISQGLSSLLIHFSQIPNSTMHTNEQRTTNINSQLLCLYFAYKQFNCTFILFHHSYSSGYYYHGPPNGYFPLHPR